MNPNDKHIREHTHCRVEAAEKARQSREKFQSYFKFGPEKTIGRSGNIGLVIFFLRL
jgi:hypothetical protein